MFDIINYSWQQLTVVLITQSLHMNHDSGKGKVGTSKSKVLGSGCRRALLGMS